MVTSETYEDQVLFEALHDGCMSALASGPVVKCKPRVCVLVPALPSEIRADTLRSIAYQSVAPSCIILLTEKVGGNLAFPAKMSLILNNMLGSLRLESFDYLLRVDADAVLPLNFIEQNIAAGFDVLGEGYAQLIKVSSFVEHCGGRFHPDHDDGYILVKFAQLGLNVSHTGYVVAPVLCREPGYHHGSGWFVAQGELKYRYGWEPVALFANTFYNLDAYRCFEVIGYFSALFRRLKRFDVSATILHKQLGKYRYPSRFFRVAGFIVKTLRGIQIE